MNTDPWVKLVTASDDYLANLLSGRLDSAGIETRLVKNDPGAISYLRAGHDPNAPVDVYVLQDQLEDAKAELRAVEEEADDADVDIDGHDDGYDDATNGGVPVLAAGGRRPLYYWVALILVAVFLLTFLSTESPIGRLLGF